MRVTGGEFRGRLLKSPGGETRPTQDRVREALFSMLAGRLGGVRFLDLFAGSGSVGLDAASRGAGLVWWVERDSRNVDCLRANVESLLGDAEPGLFRVLRMDVFSFLRNAQASEAFDVVFADPPYERPVGGGAGAQPAGGGLVERLLGAIAADWVLKRDGLFVMEQHADQPVCVDAGWRVLRDRAYGTTRLVIYARAQVEGP